MKVRCNNSDGWIRKKSLLGIRLNEWKEVNGPKMGEIYTVIDEVYEEGIKYFILLEWPTPRHDPGWEAICFDPIEERYEKISFNQIRERSSIN